MYLNRAKVENFRGFHRINIAFEPTTVLIGENNYGKTSLLDILQICLGYRAESGGFPFRARDFRRPDGRENESPPPIKVSLTFREGGVRERSPWRRSKLRKVFTDGPRRSFQLVLKVTAELEPKNGRIDVGWSFVAPGSLTLGEPERRIQMRTQPGLPFAANIRPELEPGPPRWNGLQFRDSESSNNRVSVMRVPY